MEVYQVIHTEDNILNKEWKYRDKEEAKAKFERIVVEMADDHGWQISGDDVEACLEDGFYNVGNEGVSLTSWSTEEF